MLVVGVRQMNHALLIDDLPVNRQLRFTVAGHTLHLIRTKGESVEAFYLRLLAYRLYAERPGLEQHLDWHGKFAPDWACVDLKGNITFYLRTRPLAWDELLYVLRHHGSAEVALVKILACDWEDDALDELLNHEIRQFKRQIHYRYLNGRLGVTFLRPLGEWFDPQQLTVPEDVCRTIRF